MEQVRAKYDCTQHELYSIANTVYNSLDAHLAEYAAYKSKYTAAFVSAAKQRVSDAKGKPDADNMTSKHKTLEIDLQTLAKNCCRNFPLLKGHIEDAFDKAQHSTQFTAAGGKQYETASHFDWEDVAGLNSSMITYISENSTALTTDGYMPAAFATKVSDDSALFLTAYEDFLAARQTGETTTDRLKGNNAIYDELIGVCTDGQRLFADEPEKKKLFIFEVVKSLVSPPGSASLKLRLIRQGENTPIAGANVNIQAAGGQVIKGVSDENGVVLFDNIDPADYTVTVYIDGVVVLQFEKEVNTGTAARKDVEI